MKKELFVEIGGTTYRKSSYSNSGGQLCVGVAFDDLGVLVTNTNSTQPIVRFTNDEWTAFLAGVKDNEFDIE